MGRGKAKGKEGQRWVVEPLKEVQERVGLCAEQGERVDHVGQWRRAAEGHLEEH